METSLFDFAAKGMKAQIEINKFCHINDPETSREAAEKMIESGALSAQEEWVYRKLLCFLSAQEDFTAKELAHWITNWQTQYDYTYIYQIIQRRLSGLHRKGKIKRTGDKRDGCMVWRLA